MTHRYFKRVRVQIKAAEEDQAAVTKAFWRVILDQHSVLVTRGRSWGEFTFEGPDVDVNKVAREVCHAALDAGATDAAFCDD